MDRDWCLLARWWRNEIPRYSQLLGGDWTGSSRHRFWGLPDVAQLPGSQRLEEMCPRSPSVVSEARRGKEQARARCVGVLSIQRLEGGRWRLRWMRANGWTRPNGYGN